MPACGQARGEGSPLFLALVGLHIRERIALDCTAHIVVAEVSVYLRRGNGRVSEKLLQREYVSVAVLVHQRSRRVTELVRGYAFAVKSCLAQRVFNNLLNTPL